jgi:predicted nucleotidyltransferase component of viral defense system
VIEKPEIDAKADELGVHVSNVQRDYVLGWLLSGLYQPDNPLHKTLVLKGGNCFRKAYFERARFSNDLDFSVQSEGHSHPCDRRGSIQRLCAVLE